MFKKIIKPLLVLSMMAVSIFSYAATQSFDEIVAAIESKLPVMEKQAELVIKMLDIDKHRLKLQADLDKLIEGKPEKARNTYLHLVFKNKEASFEQSAIKASALLRASNSTWIQPLHPGFLFNVCLGVDSHQGNKGVIYENKDFFQDSVQTEKLISLCNRLLKIQQPVREAAKSKLNFGEKVFDDVKTVDMDDVPRNAYAFLLPVKINLENVQAH